MRRIILLGLLIMIFIAACNKNDSTRKSNAEILSFNSEKCLCCWGWVIKIGNDTIKSNNEIIGETIGYEVEFPVHVFIETGEIQKKCSENGFENPNFLKDYYEVVKIEKIE